jgi:hypothetical protein
MAEGYDIKNLMDIYQFINKKAFAGKMPKIKIRTKRSRLVSGTTTYSVAYTRVDGKKVINWDSPNTRIKDISISTNFEYSFESAGAVLAHEMVHAKIFLDKIRTDDAHGSEFKAELKRVQAKLPEFKLALTHDTEGMKRNSRAKKKTFFVVLFVGTTGDISVMSLTQNAYKSLKTDEGYERFQRIADSGRYKKIVMGTTEHENLEDYPIKKSVKKMAHSKIKNFTEKDIDVDYTWS